MARTYIPTLRVIAQGAYNYGTRWQSKLEGNLSAEQYTCLTTWIAATLNLLICLGANPIEP